MSIVLIQIWFDRNEWQSYPIFLILGLCAITQFNATNTLFQLLSPPRLRGRVLAMHIWALSGLGPFGVLAFGYVAGYTGIRLALQIGGVCVLIGALWGWAYQKGLRGIDDALAERD